MRWHSSNPVTATAMRWALACALTCGLSGCRHKPALPPLPPITQPMALLSSPEPATPPMIEPPEVNLPPMPVATGSSPRRERRRRPSAPTTTSAAQPATPAETPAVTVSPEEAAIGELSLGGEANPRAQQEAVELLNSIEGRLRKLPAQKLNMEKAQISRIRNFQKQAQQALDTGDTEGAMTLATKAKLLLDDLEK